jgi:hypothetical protein
MRIDGTFVLNVRCDGGEAVLSLEDPGAQVPTELVSRVFELVLQRRLASRPGGSYTVRLPIPAAISAAVRRESMPLPTYRAVSRQRIVVHDGAGERLEVLLREMGYDVRLERS